MAKSRLSMIGRAAKMAAIGATRCTGNMAEVALGAARDVLSCREKSGGRPAVAQYQGGRNKAEAGGGPVIPAKLLVSPLRYRPAGPSFQFSTDPEINGVKP